MLKINKKLQLPLIFLGLGISGIFLYQYLTFIPEYSSAKSISTNNPVTPTTPVTEWDDLEYMQQMTLEACNGASVNDTKQLTDSRDGKTYWVAKLKDNQCWMTQNLDLDLSTDKPLTSDDSDIDSSIGSWAPEDSSENTITTALNGTVWPNTNNIIRSWDPALGEAATYCNDGADATAGNCKASDNPTTSVNDGHDAQGNYYSWNAATAGTGSSVTATDRDATDSICPKGWQLPTSGNTNPKSFSGLTAAYNISSNAAGSTTLRTTPLYFIYSGSVLSGSLDFTGSRGHYWSSTSYISPYVRLLDFRGDYVGPSSYSYRFNGFSIRCVAKGLSAGSTPSQPTSGIDSPDIAVEVPNIITLDVSDSVSIETKTNDISEGSFTASVSSNASYSITLSSTNGGHTDLRNENGSGAIPTLTSSQSLTPGTSAWGIKCTNPANSTNCLKTTYTGLTNYLNPTLFFKSSTGGLNLPTTFQIGITVSPDLPSGTYTTDILVTTSQQ